MWIALYLPQLPLDLAYRRWPEAMRAHLEQSLPLAIVEKKRVGWSNAHAQGLGITSGMPESTARSRSAELVLVVRDEAAEVELLIETALWALRFTPQVSLLPAGLLLDVKASLRLFGGCLNLQQQLRAGFCELGVTPWLASAPTAGAARLLASHSDDAHADVESYFGMLDPLPVDLLQTAQPHLETLQSIGCLQLGQLRRLPRPGVVRRFGASLLTELDQAYGSEPEVLAWYVPPESFYARLELPSRVESADALLFAARRLLLQLTGWLTQRHAAVTRFSLHLQHDTTRHHAHAKSKIEIALGSASRDLTHLSLLLQEHLHKHELQAPVVEIALQADDLEALAAPNTELFPTAASQAESMGRLIERLVSRLGPQAVQQLTIQPDHRPERSSAQKPVQEGAPKKKSSNIDKPNKPSRSTTPRKPSTADPGTTFHDRPSWLLAKPVRLMVRQHKPFYQGHLRLLAGPERIEAGWWDDALVTRDYFIARNEEQVLLWIYRERQGVETNEPGWFLHGFFG